MCSQILLEDQISITFLVSIIKNFAISFPAIPSVLFFHRKSEHQKIQELKTEISNFDANLSLSDEFKKGILWWKSNIFTSFQNLNIPEPDLIIYTMKV